MGTLFNLGFECGDELLNDFFQVGVGLFAYTALGSNNGK